MSSKDKLLILLPNWIGDAVMATPLLARLREKLNHTKIILTGPPHVTSLFTKNNLADKLIPIKDIKKESSIALAGKARDIWKKSEIYQEEGVQKVLLLPGSLSSAITARLGKIPERLGYNRDGRKFLLTSTVDHPENFRKFHRVHYFMNLLSLFPQFKNFVATEKNTPESDPLILDTSEEANNWALKFLKDNDIKGKILAIHGGGAYGPSKRWSAESFIKALAGAAESKDFTVLITGSGEDISNGKYLAKILQDKGIKNVMAAGKTTSVEELAALLKQSSLFLSNDSGPMHIAAAFKIPQIAIFTSTSTVFTRPWNINAFSFSSNLECSPCFKRGCPLNDESTANDTFKGKKDNPEEKGNCDFPCHNSIPIKAVSDKIIELL